MKMTTMMMTTMVMILFSTCRSHQPGVCSGGRDCGCPAGTSDGYSHRIRIHIQEKAKVVAANERLG